MKNITFAFLLAVSFSAWASPCTGVDRQLTEERKVELAPVIAKQLNIESAEILQSYRYRGWYIIYVNTHVSDEAFLFFKGDPIKSRYLTTWGGGATKYEGSEITRWVRAKAKGIPKKLAACFSWHVTRDRDL